MASGSGGASAVKPGCGCSEEYFPSVFATTSSVDKVLTLPNTLPIDVKTVLLTAAGFSPKHDFVPQQLIM